MRKEYLVTENNWRIPRWSKTEKIAALLTSNRVAIGVFIAAVDLVLFSVSGEKKEEIKDDIRKGPMRVNGYKDVTLAWKSGEIWGRIVSPGDPLYKNSRIPTAEQLNNYSNFRRLSRT